MSTRSRFLGVGVALGLVAGLLVGAGFAGPGRVAAAAPPAAPGSASTGIAVGAPAAVPVITTGGGTVGSSGSAIASYPSFAGSPGLAPDNTIVVTGVGQADIASDGSDHAAAQKIALAAALADAKAQADTIAADTGLSISGVLSVSALVSPEYGVMPTVANGAGTPTCLEPPMLAPANGTTNVPQPVCPPPYQQTLSVSVTVAYRVG